jgi:hypothetical protein
VSRRAAEGDPSQLEPEPQCLLECRPGHSSRKLTLCRSGSCELGRWIDLEFRYWL